MSEKMFNALETCLQALEQGETLDAALARFPALADELRPILETSLHARSLGDSAVPGDAQRRGRAKLLQRAAEIREAKRAPRRTWIFAFRPVAVALMLVAFFLSSTGLVRASSTSLPGDNLYPVKRTWEDLRLVFVSTEQEREDLELAYENERLEEINELLAEGRTETVSFVGYVTAQTDSQWTVAGVPVVISSETSLPTDPITVGAAVMVTGRTDAQGFLVAQSIEPVEPGTVIPSLEDSDEDEDSPEGGDDGSGSGGGNDNETKPGSGSVDDSSGSEDESDSDSKSKLQGKVESMNGNVWIINGQEVDVSGAEIIGTPAPGAEVVIEGYYNAEGVFIATRVVFSNGGDDGASGGESGDDDNENENEDDNSNDNDNDDENSNDDNTNDDNTNDDNTNNDNTNDNDNNTNG